MSAGAFFDVVAQIPKSENIATWRAPESSIARMSRRSATPVDLNASTTRPLCLKRLTIAHAAAVLPEFMQVPAIATTGTPCASSGTSRFSGTVETRAGTPTRCPKYGKSSTQPKTRQSNGSPCDGLIESQMPITPPRFSSCTTSPGARCVGRCPE